MPDQPTGSTRLVTLDAEAAEPLRQAAYTRLELDLDQLETALLSRSRARNRRAWAAYMRLARTAGLLDRTGWTHHQREPVTLDPEHFIVAQAALRNEIDAESDAKATALADGAHDAAHAATDRALALYYTLTTLEASAAETPARRRKHGASTR